MFKKKVSFLRIMVLLWADMLAAYVMWIMQTYLTDVWKLGFTHAAGIMNVYTGLTKFVPLVLFIFVDAGLGNYWVLLLSSTAFSIGLGFLSMSTPPILSKATGTCKDYNPNCLGHTQKALFYTALALIAAGLSGHVVSLVAFADNQFEKKPDKPKDTQPKIRSSMSFLYKIKKGPDGKLDYVPNRGIPSFIVRYQTRTKQQADSAPDTVVDLSQLQFQPLEAMLALVKRERIKLFRSCLIILIPVIGLIALPYIKPWSLRFGIPAICTLVATLAFLQGTPWYEEESKPEGSPVTNVLRVFVASTRNMFQDPKQYLELYEKQQPDIPKLPHTKGLLRFLDKAALPLKTVTEEPEKYRWRLCTRTEVEETKIIIRMIPIWITFILCGLVSSIGNTYFVEQANHMNYKVGKLKFPNSIILVLYEIAKSRYKVFYTATENCLGKKGKKKCAPLIGIAVAIVFSVLCCITAAKIETQRIHVIRSHGLLDKPDNKIPMSVFVLLPQYFLLAGLDSFYENSVAPFLTDQSPPSMKKYLAYLNPGLSGLGVVGSVLSVYVVGKVGERGGKPNWFQYTLNKSRLDRYYWVLAVISAVNFIWFVSMAMWFPLREEAGNDEEKAGNEEEAGNQENEGRMGNREWVDPSLNFIKDMVTSTITHSDKA